MIKRLILVLCKSEHYFKTSACDLLVRDGGGVRVLLSDGMYRKTQKAYKPGFSHTEIMALIAKLHLITCPVTSCSAKESTCQQKQSPYKLSHAAFQFFIGICLADLVVWKFQ